jgi:hypothetical protein
MVGQILLNNNEKCYSNFSPKFSQLNTALAHLVKFDRVSWSSFENVVLVAFPLKIPEQLIN